MDGVGIGMPMMVRTAIASRSRLAIRASQNRVHSDRHPSAVRSGMPLHFLTVSSITGIAAGLGALLEHPHGHIAAGVRWLPCAGVALYFLNAAIGGIIIRRPLHWLFAWGLPGTAAPVVLAAVGGGLRGVLLAWLLVAIVSWQAAYVWLVRRRAAATSATATSG